MEVFFRDIQLLTRFYGCTIFDESEERKPVTKLFYIHATDRHAEGIGYYDENQKQFVLKKGSILASVVVSSYKSSASRDQFISEHCKTDKGQIVLLHDVPMDSPSGASGYVLGRPSNGWDDWKDSEGIKLGQIIKR